MAKNTYMQLVGCGVTIAPYVPDALARKLEDTSCQNPARRPQLRVIPGGVREVGLSLGPEHVCSERVQRATKVVADDLRGRWEVLLALLAVALCAALVISWALSGQVGAAGAGEVALEEHVVMDGDSLWDISEAHPVEGLTTSEVIDLIREENDLFGTVIQPGQTILVPAQAGVA